MSLVEWASTGSEATQRLNIKNPTEIRMNFCRIFFLHKKLKSIRLPFLPNYPIFHIRTIIHCNIVGDIVDQRFPHPHSFKKFFEHGLPHRSSFNRACMVDSTFILRREYTSAPDRIAPAAEEIKKGMMYA